MRIESNTGLISQNYDAVNRVNNRLVGSTAEDLQGMVSGTMRKLSEEEVKAMRQKEESKAITLNVDSSEIINNIYSETGSNVTYKVAGVTFTNDEMKACKEVVKSAISALPTKGSDLDYRDYAMMGIVSNAVSSYASSNLTAEQAKVLNGSIESYFNSLITAEQERQKKQGYFIDNTEGVGNTGELNKYYNARYNLISSDVAEGFARALQNLPEQAKSTLLANLSGVVKNGSVAASATNKELTNSIKQLFLNADLNEANSTDEALSKYKSLMTPAYKAYGLQNTAKNNSLESVLAQDTNRFLTLISNMKAVRENVGNSLSCRV